MSKKQNLEEVMREIFGNGSQGLQFFGKKVLFSMIDYDKEGSLDNVAEISISTAGTHGHYPMLHVKIQSKEHGTIAENSFVFEDYLKRDSFRQNMYIWEDGQMPRRIGFPDGYDCYICRPVSTVHNMYIWEDGQNGYDWYICRPVSTKPIVDAIFAYIEMYS